MKLKQYEPWKGDYSVEKTLSQGRLIASPVAFTAMLFSSVPYTHPDCSSLSLAAQIMENKILHMRIREQGGAYGCGAVNSVLAGQFYFFAYRDPHLANTLKAFREAAESISKGEFDEEDLLEAKMELFQDLDSPIAPSSRAMTAYLRLRGGRSFEIRQKFRDSLFFKQKEEIRKAAKEHLLRGLEEGIIVTFANKELFEKENVLLKEKALPIYPI